MKNISYLLKNLNLMDPRGIFDQVQDIYVRQGRIEKIGPGLNLEADCHLDLAGHWACPGFVDVHVHLRDPGFPEKETMETGCQAGLAGGFTHLVAMANTQPVMDSRERIEAFYRRAQTMPLHLYTLSALSKGLRGQDLVDMEAAKEAGALGFSDDGFPISNLDLVHQAFQKSKDLDLPLSFHEEDPAYVWDPGVNLGPVARILGLRGADPYSEYSYVARDGALALKYKNKVDIQHISCLESAQLVQTYHELGAQILGEITPHHLSLSQDRVLSSGPLAKMNPPLREQKDVQGLRSFLAKEAFVLATDHAPHTLAEKSQPFSQAPSGIVGLETAFALAYRSCVLEGPMEIRDLLDSMTYKPALFYQIPYPGLREAEEANFNIIKPKEDWIVEDSIWRGKSKNSPLKGEILRGRVKMTYCKNQLHIF